MGQNRHCQSIELYFFLWKRKRKSSIGNSILHTTKQYQQSYIVLRGRWCNVIVRNVHAPSEEKSDDSKDSFYEELDQVFDHFPRYYMKILSGDFNAKVERKNIFKPTIGNESLHQDINDNCVRIVNLAKSKILAVKSKIFPHRKIHNTSGTILMGRLTRLVTY